MQVDVYAPFRNEQAIAPHILNYWALLPIRNIYLLDNETTDGSIDLIRQRFPHVYNIPQLGKFSDLTVQWFKNQAWKQWSRGQVDFVIISDFDEVVYANDICAELQRMKDSGGTIANLKALCAWCTDENFPQGTELIHKQPGILFRYDKQYDKKILFDPNRLTEINYGPGCHWCNPRGDVKWYDAPISMFHFSHLGLKYFLSRRATQGPNLSEDNIRRGWGMEFIESPESLTKGYWGYQAEVKPLSEYMPT